MPAPSGQVDWKENLGNSTVGEDFPPGQPLIRIERAAKWSKMSADGDRMSTAAPPLFRYLWSDFW